MQHAVIDIAPCDLGALTGIDIADAGRTGRRRPR
jgi:hypothetical protein